MKDRLADTPSVEDFLASSLKRGDKVAVDPWLVSTSLAKKYMTTFEKAGISLVSVERNPVDKIWDENGRVPPVKSKVIVHPVDKAGKSTKDKLVEIRAKMSPAKALIVSALDEIAWLLNIRGSDVKCNPVVVCYAIVEMNRVRLFIDEAQICEDARAHLGGEVEIHPYESIARAVKELPHDKIWVDASTVNYAITSCISSEDRIINKPSPIILAKALKNEVELEGMRNAHKRDAVACIKYFQWLEERLQNGDTTLNEVNVSDKLEAFRASQKDFVSLSFDTISGFGKNGAIIHYHAHEDTAALLSTKEMYLCDSGGQYKDGTTDITRTFHFGEPSSFEKRCYTRVLQGHIAIASLVFPVGMYVQILIYLFLQHMMKHIYLYLLFLCGRDMWGTH
jgi:Xaa-Pro aminopeptidase